MLVFRFAISIVVSLSVLLTACGSDAGDMGDRANGSPTATSGNVETTATRPEPSPTAPNEASPTARQPATTVPSTGEPYELVASWGEPALLVEPADLAVMPDGRLIVADRMRGRLVLLDDDGTPAEWWDVGSGRGLVAVDGDGAIYAPSGTGPGLVKYDAGGNVLATLDPNGSYNLSDIAADGDGYVYFASGESRSGSSTPPPFRGIYVFDPSGERVAVWAAPLAYHPHAVTVTPDGTIYVSAIVKDDDQSLPDDDVLIRIERDTYDPNDWIESHVALPAEMMIGALAVTPDGGLYVLQEHMQDPGVTTTVSILRLDQTGEVTAESAIDGATLAPYSSANGIAAAPDGGLYLADERNHRVLKLNAAGNVQAEYRGGGPRTLSVPTAIEIGTDGQVYVVRSEERR
jgi:streptogramin lyase